MEILSRHHCFGGVQSRFQHQSSSTDSTMTFSTFQPGGQGPFPVVYWLSGLTCTDENFSTKSGAQRVAAELGITLVIPDTSPRGQHIPDNEAYDLGQGAGFYVNATEAPWAQHYKMYDYVVTELPNLIEQSFNVTQQRAISGHSMGGHGALVIGLRNTDRYSSISAFSPIVNPTQCPWGQKAFRHYLGEDMAAWAQYDACQLLEKADLHLPIKLSVGLADEFLSTQLLIDNFLDISRHQAMPVEYDALAHYDHSYYFIASQIESHLRFHSRHFE